MNTRVRLGVLWGLILTGVILAITGLLNMFNGMNRFPGRTGRYAAQGGGFQGRGFRHQSIMYGRHLHHGFHGAGFLIFLLIGLAVLFFLVKWFRKKTEAHAVEHIIDEPAAQLPIPAASLNAAILDEWEQSIINQKEND